MNFPQNIIVHHTYVSRDENNEQFDAVKNYHIKTKGWGDIGYHYFLEPDGVIKEGRDEKNSGAHCAEKLMNYRSIGICLAGNFDEEDPTPEQLQALTRLIARLKEKYKIPSNKVFTHRYFTNYKSCPGVRFTDKILEEIAKGTFPLFFAPEWSEDGIEWTKSNRIITKITGEPVPDYRLAVILKNFADRFQVADFREQEK